MCIYFYNKMESSYEARVVKNAKMQPTISEMKCDQINKDTVLSLLNSFAAMEKDTANILLWLGLFLGWTSGFSLFLLYRNKAKFQAS
jgi:hypothetical protein